MPESRSYNKVTIVVGKDERGNYVFASSRGVGTSEDERKKALQIDDRVKKSLKELEARLKKSGLLNSTVKAEAYWEFGSVVRKLVDLVDPAEVKLFWQNVEMNASEELLARNRGPNRIHVEYCFRLAGYPKDLALQREWSEWVFLFDSPSVNHEDRFDRWDQSQLRVNPSYASRNNTRSFIRCLNSMLKNVQTEDLSDEELIRCYEGSAKLSRALVETSPIASGLAILMKATIQDYRSYVSDLMDGKMGPDDFATRIIDSAKTRPSV